MVLKKYVIMVYCVINVITLSAQVFKKGDVIINFNYGAPNIAAWSERRNFGGSIDDFLYRSIVKYSRSTGVISLRAEYAITDKLSLGLSSGYWHMEVANSYTYSESYKTNVGLHTGAYNYHLSSTSIAARVNYHFWSNTVIDAYTGIGLGITQHVSTYEYFPGVGSALTPHTFVSGRGPCIAVSVGFKYYPVPYVGLNLEMGYDTGALFLAGLVINLLR